ILQSLLQTMLPHAPLKPPASIGNPMSSRRRLQFSRGAQNYLLRAGYRFNRAVLDPCDPWYRRAVIEPPRQLGLKGHLARQPTDDADEVSHAIRRRHEINDYRSAGLGAKFGL